jgi:hypothetical protein
MEASTMDRYEMLVAERMANSLREAKEARLGRLVHLARQGCRTTRVMRARRRIGELLISAGTALAGSPTRGRHGQRTINRPA